MNLYHLASRNNQTSILSIEQEGRNICLYMQDQRNKNQNFSFSKNFYQIMTILNSPTISTSAWIRRGDPRPLSGNGLRESKRNYNTGENSIITGLVSTIQVGSHNLTPPGAWIGLEEESQKFLTTHDLGQAVVYMRAAEIIVNSNFIQSEREAPIDVFNQIVFGGETDNSRTIKYYRSIFLEDNNDFKKNSCSTGHCVRFPVDIHLYLVSLMDCCF